MVLRRPAGDDDRDSDEEVIVHHQFADLIHRERLETFERDAERWRLAGPLRSAARPRVWPIELRRRRRMRLGSDRVTGAHGCR